MEADGNWRYLPRMPAAELTFGILLGQWRQRRRMSQLDLAMAGETSTRHLSFLETGRAQPSRHMVLHLAEHLAVPLRERNMLLAAAGYAPAFTERRLDDPTLAAARRAVDLVLEGHAPYPAIAVDRHWTLVAGNEAADMLLAGVSHALLRPPVNVMRLALHPDGLAPRIINFAEWRAHLLERVCEQVEASADPVLMRLADELRSYPAPVTSRPLRPARDYAGMILPLELATEAGALAFFSTVTMFGTPVDVTLSELALECFYPADAATAALLRHAGEKRALQSSMSGSETAAPDPHHRPGSQDDVPAALLDDRAGAPQH